MSERDGNRELYLMDTDGQNQCRFTFNPSGDWRPTWFSDSQWLAFTSDRSGNNDIYQLTMPTSTLTLTVELELTPLVVHPADDRDPAIYYSYGGENELLFLSDREGLNRVYKMGLNIYSNVPFALTTDQQLVHHPAWNELSPEKFLMAMEQNGQSDIYFGKSHYDGFTPLTDSPAFDGQPAWGPARWIPTTATNQVWLKQSQP